MVLLRHGPRGPLIKGPKATCFFSQQLGDKVEIFYYAATAADLFYYFITDAAAACNWYSCFLLFIIITTDAAAAWAEAATYQGAEGHLFDFVVIWGV